MPPPLPPPPLPPPPPPTPVYNDIIYTIGASVKRMNPLQHHHRHHHLPPLFAATFLATFLVISSRLPRPMWPLVSGTVQWPHGRRRWGGGCRGGTGTGDSTHRRRTLRRVGQGSGWRRRGTAPDQPPSLPPPLPLPLLPRLLRWKRWRRQRRQRRRTRGCRG